jgi:hypothetical protein
MAGISYQFRYKQKYNMVIDPVSGIGMIFGLLAWLRAEIGTRDILQHLDSEDLVDNYLEWLRRKDQSQLIAEINASKNDLLSQLAEVGPQITALAGQIYSLAGDLQNRLDDLNTKISSPALYSIPLETRASAPISLRYRNKEVEFVSKANADMLLVGQPGIGKTYLLTELARITDAKFLLTSDPEAAITAVTAACPEIVIIDDAWARLEVVKRLCHARMMHKLRFRIVAVCWPFEKEDLQQAFPISSGNILELEELPRKEIAAIIKDVAAIHKMVPNNAFIRIAAKQARGRPGFAVSLTLATIQSSGAGLLSGDILLRDLGVFMQRYVSDDARILLAAFACGGENGIGIVEVAKSLNKDIGLTKARADKIALIGTLEQTGKDTLAVQPEFLRAALIKQVFFPEKGAGLPWKICELLILSSPEPASGYQELFRARSLAGAAIADALLRKITTTIDDYRLWSALAWLDANNCNWVFEHQQNCSADAKRAGLHYVPENILPRLLTVATDDKRPLNSFPEADMRLISDWIQQGWSEEAVRRRLILFNTVTSWLRSGGDTVTGFTAIQSAFDLKYEATESDPADSQTINIRSGPIPLDAAKKVFELWPTFLETIRAQQKIPWPKIIQIANQWSGQYISLGHPLPAEYSTFLEECFRQMILDLLPLAGENQAVRRWIFLKAKKKGIELEKCPVSEEFLTLYPEESFDGDYKKRETKHAEAVQVLVDRWKGRAIDEIVHTILTWKQQVEESTAIYSHMPDVFWAKLATSRSTSTEELSVILEKLPSQYVGPFISAAIADGKLIGNNLNLCLSRSELAWHLVEPVLTGKMPELYDRVSEYFPSQHFYIGGLSARGAIPNDLLERLLRHKNSRLRFTIASQISMPKNEISIPDSLQSLWRIAVVESLTDMLTSDDYEHELYLHKLEFILKKDPTIAFEVLRAVLPQRTFLSMRNDRHLHELVDNLDYEQRKILLPLCKDLFHSDMPAILVGGDLNLYNDVLADDGLQRYHLNLLAGDPTTANWASFAKAALKKGYKHSQVMFATQGDGYSWSGDLSGYYQQWADRFEKLKNSGDSDLQRIGDEGFKWAILNRDACRRNEKREQVFGLL